MATIWARIPTGTQAEPNEYGVEIDGGAADNVIGTDGNGDEAEQANRISGNTNSGVDIGGADQTIGFAPGSVGIAQLLTLNGSQVVQGGQLQLLSATSGAAGSAFTPTPMDISQFSTQFQFQFANDFGNGFTFTIQGHGPTALGAGGSLGYQGIGQSVAVKFEPSDGNASGYSTTGFYTDGAPPTVPAIDLNSLNVTGISLASMDVFRVDMAYSGTTLSVTITDTDTGASETDSYQVDIPNMVGGPNAYVGFTGSTSGYGGDQDILSWSFTSPGNAHGNRIVGNVITQNSGPGVVVVGGDSVGNAILANSIFANAGQAIDLGDDGVTDNSTAPRLGPDNLQNFPIIVATADGPIEGWLAGSTPDTTYRIDVFASAGYGPGGAGRGPGRTWGRWR